MRNRMVNRFMVVYVFRWSYKNREKGFSYFLFFPYFPIGDSLFRVQNCLCETMLSVAMEWCRGAGYGTAAIFLLNFFFGLRESGLIPFQTVVFQHLLHEVGKYGQTVRLPCPSSPVRKWMLRCSPPTAPPISLGVTPTNHASNDWISAGFSTELSVVAVQVVSP